MRSFSSTVSTLRQLIGCFLLASLVTGAQIALGQTPPGVVEIPRRALPASVEQALGDTDRASRAELVALERSWRDVFREAQSRRRLEGFVAETIGFFEKLQQIQERVINPADTEQRIATLFRKRILDEDTVCRLAEQSLVDFCQKLDEQDQALLIRLKIDREVAGTTLSRSVVDPAAFKRPIHSAASSAVKAVQDDLSRSVASFVASEVIGAITKRAARDAGLMPGEEGSFADFFGGLVVQFAIDITVDAVTDPTDQMVRDLETQLSRAEREILDGTATSPGLITALRRVGRERAQARRKLLEAEFSK